MAKLNLDLFKNITNVHWQVGWDGVLVAGHQHFSGNPPAAPANDYYGHVLGSGGPETPELIGSWSGKILGGEDSTDGSVLVYTYTVDGHPVPEVEGLFITLGDSSLAAPLIYLGIIEIEGYGTYRVRDIPDWSPFNKNYLFWQGASSISEGVHNIHSYIGPPDP